MILLRDVVQVLHRSMLEVPTQGSLRFHRFNRRVAEASLIGVDDMGLWMRWIAERLAEQRWAAAASRDADSRKSMVAPVESMAGRGNTISPLTRMCVSSIRQV